MGDEAEDDEAVKKYIWGIVDKVNAANPGYKMIKKAKSQTYGIRKEYIQKDKEIRRRQQKDTVMSQ